MTNDQIREQLELTLQNLDCHTPEANLDLLFLALYPERIIRFKKAEMVAKFYGFLGSWTGSGNRNIIASLDLENITESNSEDSVTFRKVGGKRAREYLKEYKIN